MVIRFINGFLHCPAAWWTFQQGRGHMQAAATGLYILHNAGTEKPDASQM
jgi:hypothetical protein